jgi:hypothetical protein
MISPIFLDGFHLLNRSATTWQTGVGIICEGEPRPGG